MNWTHEELKSFPFVSKTGRVIKEGSWFRFGTTGLFIQTDVDFRDGSVNIIDGYYTTGNKINPARRWSTLDIFSRAEPWKEVLTPKAVEYDPKQQPYEDTDI